MRRLPRLRRLLLFEGVLPCALAALLLDVAFTVGLSAPRPALGGLIAIGIVAIAWLSWRRMILRTANRMRDAAAILDAVAAGDPEIPRDTPDTWEGANLADAMHRVAASMHAAAERASENRTEADIETLATLREAQAARRSKSYFLAAVGDRFRQPLQAMQLLTASLGPDANAAEQVVLDPLQECVDGMARLLEELLDLSRLEAGVVFVHPQPVAVAELLRDALEPVITRATANGVTLRVHAGCHAVRTDPALATQLLRRLADNAIEHAPQGRILIAARRRNGVIRIEVRDNGPGIALIHQRRIFDEFVQLAGARQHGGFGLGLPIADRLARVLHTKVALRSAPGAGSTFSFDLVDLPLGEVTHLPGEPVADPMRAIR